MQGDGMGAMQILRETDTWPTLASGAWGQVEKTKLECVKIFQSSSGVIQICVLDQHGVVVFVFPFLILFIYLFFNLRTYRLYILLSQSTGFMSPSLIHVLHAYIMSQSCNTVGI